MKRNIPILIGLCCLIVIAGSRVSGQPNAIDFSSISKEEIELLLADVAKTNPMILKRFAEDPEMKKQQLESLRQLLAFASQAQRDGLASDPTNKQEMENIRAEVLAVNYDREINKDKGPMPPFGFITDEQVKAYWGEKEKIGQADSTERRTHEAELNDFLNAKIEVLKASNPEMKDREISDEERTQARDIFAKTRIYKSEYDRKAKSGELSKEFVDKANLQVKLQQAQFLARLYSEKVMSQTLVTDEDIAKYIAVHPELDLAQKRAKAQSILDRVKAGEDFATLANKFTEDPGNKDANGVGQGGIYKNVPTGKMVAPFETAALALQPGKVASELVETDFGFHIIKLERKLGAKKGSTKKQSYDVRHILISTGFKDPADPKSREKPVKDYVRTKLETETEKQLLDKLVVDNNIQVPSDFAVPEVTEEQIEKLRQKQQMQMPPVTGAEPDGNAMKPVVKKPKVVKKRAVRKKHLVKGRC